MERLAKAAVVAVLVREAVVAVAQAVLVVKVAVKGD